MATTPHYGSSTGTNFYASAMIPCTTEPSAEMQGMCLVNVDGACIRGGQRVAGNTGYTLAGLGYPGGQCYALGMFAGSNKRYTQFGWDVSGNANVLKLTRPVL